MGPMSQGTSSTEMAAVIEANLNAVLLLEREQGDWQRN
jgi:hypothetical protein